MNVKAPFQYVTFYDHVCVSVLDIARQIGIGHKFLIGTCNTLAEKRPTEFAANFYKTTAFVGSGHWREAYTYLMTEQGLRMMIQHRYENLNESNKQFIDTVYDGFAKAEFELHAQLMQENSLVTTSVLASQCGVPEETLLLCAVGKGLITYIPFIDFWQPTMFAITQNLVYLRFVLTSENEHELTSVWTAAGQKCILDAL